MAACAALVLLLHSCGNGKKEKSEPQKESLVIKGSETELNMVSKLREAFARKNGTPKIQLSGGGSEEGINLLVKNAVDIANASRKMTEAEISMARKNHVEPVPVIFAVDVIAVITHPKLSVDSLSLSELAAVYSGEITNWKTLKGPDAPIHLYGRDLHSGTYHYFKQKVLKAEYAPGMDMSKNYSDIINKVENDPYGIGYVSLAHLVKNGKPHNRTWAVYLYVEGSPAISPYEKRWVYEGLYPLIRPLYQYTNGTPTGAAKKFIDFELSPAGQEIINQTEFYPINDFHRHINRKSLEMEF